MSQTDAILAHMEASNTITPLEALSLCGSLALHSRISEIRERGFAVQKIMERANGKTFGCYFLAIPC